MDTNLREKFEQIIENCDGRTYFQVNQYYFDLMQAAYNIAKSESAELIQILEAINQQLVENAQSMGETNKQLAKRLLAIQNIVQSAGNGHYRDITAELINDVLNPTKESLLASIEDGWISCNDRLPQNSNWVRVCLNGQPSVIPCTFEAGWYEYGNYGSYVPPVTHWKEFNDAPPQQ